MAATPNESTPRLVHAVVQLASCPCPPHEDAFLAALRATPELLFRQVASTGPPQLQLVTSAGATRLLAYPDIDAARRADPRATYVGIPTLEALAMVRADPAVAGILVAAATDDDAWVVADRPTVDALLGPAAP